MEITEVRIKLMEDQGERLQAFCSITFDDCFVIRDLKIIEGTNGPFVAMPSRKLTGHCPQCGCKNHLRAAYCNQCGGRLADDRAARDDDGRAKLYADIAHPINTACREQIQLRVIAAFQREIEQAKLPGYISRYDDIDQETGCDLADDGARRTGRQPTAETTQIQPPQRPHGPHKSVTRSSVSQPRETGGPHLHAQPPQSGQEKAARPGEFGAGIF